MTQQAQTLTSSQVTWAKAHDWFVSYDPTTGVLTVADIYVQNGQPHSETVAWSGSFKELRVWAGY